MALRIATLPSAVSGLQRTPSPNPALRGSKSSRYWVRGVFLKSAHGLPTRQWLHPSGGRARGDNCCCGRVQPHAWRLVEAGNYAIQSVWFRCATRRSGGGSRVVAAVHGTSGEVDTNVGAFKSLDPWSNLFAVPVNGLPGRGVRASGEHRDMVSALLEMTRSIRPTCPLPPGITMRSRRALSAQDRSWIQRTASRRFAELPATAEGDLDNRRGTDACGKSGSS